VPGELVVGDEIRRSLDEHAQQFEGELAELDSFPAAPQSPLPHVERQVIEAVSLSRRYGHTRPSSGRVGWNAIGRNRFWRSFGEL
jgi:hypothetical protein